MKTLETRITINAAPDKVWNVLMDFENYPNWNPFIQQISGQSHQGGKLRILIGLGEKPMQFKPSVLKCETAAEFRWLGKLFIKGIFDGEHYFKLKATKDGGTEFIHGENFKGLFSGVIMRKIGDKTKDGFLAMNKALKNQAELK